MNNPTWHLQIFEMSSRPAQESLIELLSASTLTVDGQACEVGIFLIIESADRAEAKAVTELVCMTDLGARLIHETSGSAQPALAG